MMVPELFLKGTKVLLELRRRYLLLPGRFFLDEPFQFLNVAAKIALEYIGRLENSSSGNSTAGGSIILGEEASLLLPSFLFRSEDEPEGGGVPDCPELPEDPPGPVGLDPLPPLLSSSRPESSAPSRRLTPSIRLRSLSSMIQFELAGVWRMLGMPKTECRVADMCSSAKRRMEEKRSCGGSGRRGSDGAESGVEGLCGGCDWLDLSSDMALTGQLVANAFDGGSAIVIPISSPRSLSLSLRLSAHAIVSYRDTTRHDTSNGSAQYDAIQGEQAWHFDMSTPASAAGSPPASGSLTVPQNKRRISANTTASGASTPGGPSTKKSKVSGGTPAMSRKTSMQASASKSHPLRQTSFPPENAEAAARRRRSASVTSNATTSFTRGNSVDRVLAPPPGGGKDDAGGGTAAGGKGGDDDGDGSDEDIGDDLLTIMRVGDMEELEEQKEEEQRRLNILMDHFDSDQMARYEAYRRGTLQKSAVKKVANLVLGQSISANVASAIGGFSKIFAGEMVERAREIQKAWGDDKPGAPLLPEHIREAARRWRLENGKTAGDHVAAMENGNRRTVVGGMGGRLFKELPVVCMHIARGAKAKKIGCRNLNFNRHPNLHHMLPLSRAARRPPRVRLPGLSPQAGSRLFSSLGQIPRPSSAPRLSASRHIHPLSRSLVGVRSFSLWPSRSEPTPPAPATEAPTAAPPAPAADESVAAPPAAPAIEGPEAVDAPPASDVDTAPLSSFTEFPKAVPTEHASSIVDRWLPSVPELQEAVTHQPDTMGYLSALGLENGWGPTTMMQNILESIHVYAGAPWWATVLLTVATIRIGFFPLFARLADNTARMKEIRPHLNPLIERQMQAIQQNDKVAQQQIVAEMQVMYKRVGASPLLPITGFLQIPFQIGSFFILRQMAYLPVPGLDTAGILWFTDLTSADPYFILPLTSAGLLFASLRFTVTDALSGQSAKIMSMLSYFLPAISLAVTCTMPSILTLYFSATSFLAFLQASAFRSAKVRAYLGLYPLNDNKVENPLLQSGNLSDAARSRLEADRAVVEAQREKMSSQSTSTNMVSMALGSKDGVVAGIKEQLAKSREDAKYKEYEKKAAEMDKAKKRMESRIMSLGNPHLAKRNHIQQANDTWYPIRPTKEKTAGIQNYRPHFNIYPISGSRSMISLNATSSSFFPTMGAMVTLPFGACPSFAPARCVGMPPRDTVDLWPRELVPAADFVSDAFSFGAGVASSKNPKSASFHSVDSGDDTLGCGDGVGFGGCVCSLGGWNCFMFADGSSAFAPIELREFSEAKDPLRGVG
ncbi:hypothetical protein Dda_8486 [Drechslerella dactyloides]|uniref:Transcription initiation factor TFIID subunit 11 n=1 Tax=Drechslerella dactyloides TaxID=74499 RepID=A0AAD6ITC3_DREDA|nr:hypothetical protein Dda_8486 [Drechslerella dactyloides]